MACYLVFTTRMSADQAILFVRAKRPNSIQTRGQLLCVREFAQFLVPLRSVFSCVEPKASAVTLSQYLTRQRHLLHGYEARQMKNVPKVVQLVCRLLVDIAANRQVEVEEEWVEIPDLTAEVEKTVSQQALQQLGNEMRGKGIPVAPLSPAALQAGPEHLLWDEAPLNSSLLSNRNLSCSDSVLHRPAPQQQRLGNLKSYRPTPCLIRHALSHSSLTAFSDLSPQGNTSSFQDSASEANQDTGSPFLKRRLHKGHQSLSLDLSEQRRKHKPTLPSVTSDVPFVTLQSELSPESRRLLVARALAMDLTDQDLSSKISAWQVHLRKPV